MGHSTLTRLTKATKFDSIKVQTHKWCGYYAWFFRFQFHEWWIDDCHRRSAPFNSVHSHFQCFFAWQLIFNRFSLPINRNLEIARCSDATHRLHATTVEPFFSRLFFLQLYAFRYILLKNGNFAQKPRFYQRYFTIHRLSFEVNISFCLFLTFDTWIVWVQIFTDVTQSFRYTPFLSFIWILA